MMISKNSLIKKLLFVLFAIVVLTILASAYVVYAEEDVRIRGESIRRVSGVPSSSSSPSAVFVAPVSPPGGGINSSTVGEVDTGENQGGVVSTGDEHVEVFEVNIGPTNTEQNDPESENNDEDEEGQVGNASECQERDRNCVETVSDRTSR